MSAAIDPKEVASVNVHLQGLLLLFLTFGALYLLVTDTMGTGL